MNNKLITYILSIVLLSGSIVLVLYSIYKSNNIEKMMSNNIKIPLVGMNTLKKEMERANIQLEYMLQETEADIPEIEDISDTSVVEVKEVCSDPYCYKCLYNNWDDELKEYTKGLCEETGVPYEYVLGVIWLESRFDGSVRSSYGGYSNYGLMQINGINYEYLKDKIGLENVEDLMDEKMNIKAGITLLKEHLDYTGDYDDMILRYQVGI